MKDKEMEVKLRKVLALIKLGTDKKPYNSVFSVEVSTFVFLLDRGKNEEEILEWISNHESLERYFRLFRPEDIAGHVQLYRFITKK